MTVTYGFYNAILGDRKYDAVQLSTLFDGIINDGVFMSIGTALVVTTSAGMNVLVGVGRAWFNHTWTNNDAPLILPVQQAEGGLHRIDVVVLEVNTGDAVRANTFKVIKGTPGSVPVAPILIATSLIHQHPLCHIRVNAGVTEILQANLTNKVGTSVCPFITGILESVNIDTLLAQWEAEFDAWFRTVQDILEGASVAGHLIDTMPHKFILGGVTYRWGLVVINDIITMQYEEDV